MKVKSKHLIYKLILTFLLITTLVFGNLINSFSTNYNQ